MSAISEAFRAAGLDARIRRQWAHVRALHATAGFARGMFAPRPDLEQQLADAAGELERLSLERYMIGPLPGARSTVQ